MADGLQVRVMQRPPIDTQARDRRELAEQVRDEIAQALGLASTPAQADAH
jgi:hypothetical protein